MVRIATMMLVLALAGCVAPMPTGDENNRLLNQQAPSEAPAQWMPRMLFE